MGIARTDPVYSVFTGWAERFTSVDTDFEALTMRLDLDDDGSIDANENTFVTYMHIDISPRIEIGHRYVAKTPLGTVKDIPNHLHIGVVQGDPIATAPSSDLWDSNAPYWRDVTEWNFGRDLDFLTDDFWNSMQNIFSLNGYARVQCEGVFTDPIPLRDMKLWHRRVGDSVWRVSDTMVVAFNVRMPRRFA